MNASHGSGAESGGGAFAFSRDELLRAYFSRARAEALGLNESFVRINHCDDEVLRKVQSGTHI